MSSGTKNCALCVVMSTNDLLYSRPVVAVRDSQGMEGTSTAKIVLASLLVMVSVANLERAAFRWETSSRLILMVAYPLVSVSISEQETGSTIAINTKIKCIYCSASSYFFVIKYLFAVNCNISGTLS